MLFSLGLRRYPPIDVLLGIAAGPAPMNEKALSYLLANVSSNYINFDPTAFSAVPFIPAITPSGQSILSKPGEVRSTFWKQVKTDFRLSQIPDVRYLDLPSLDQMLLDPRTLRN